MIIGKAMIPPLSGSEPLFALINISYPVGAVCTCSNGTKTLRPVGAPWSAVVAVPYAGEWIVRITDGNDRSVSKTVEVTAPSEIYKVVIGFPVEIVLTGSGSATYCYATINGTNRYSAGTYSASPGDIVTFHVYGYSSTYYGEITINGEQMLKVTDRTTQGYSFEIPLSADNIQISMSYTSTSTRRNGKIHVTTDGVAALLDVTYETGAICTCTDGVTVLQAEDTGGSFAFVIPNSGDWTINITKGTRTESKVVSITQRGRVYTVDVPFTVPVTITGEGSDDVCYVSIDDAVYISAQTIRVPIGERMLFTVKGYNATYPGVITHNNRQVAQSITTDTASYILTAEEALNAVSISLTTGSQEESKTTYYYGTIDIVTT